MDWPSVRLTLQLACATTAILFVVALPLAWWIVTTRSRAHPGGSYRFFAAGFATNGGRFLHSYDEWARHSSRIGLGIAGWIESAVFFRRHSAGICALQSSLYRTAIYGLTQSHRLAAVAAAIPGAGVSGTDAAAGFFLAGEFFFAAFVAV